jgi:hypothetical protein
MHLMRAEENGRVRASGLLLAWRRSSGAVALAVLLVLVAYWWLSLAVLDRPGDWAFDFTQFWQGGRDVWNGVSPYPSAEQLENVRQEFHPVAIQEDFRFPYPAGAAVVLAPLGALGFDAAAAVWGLLLVGAILGSLWILGVRDWRVLAVVVTSQPVITSARLGTFTPLLLLLAAIAWRCRDRRWIAGGALAAALSLKLFLWPLVVWLLATRRFGVAAISTGLAAAVTVGAWALIGFEGMTLYPELLRRLTDIVEVIGLSLVALGAQAGLPIGVAESLPLLVGVPMLLAVFALARRADGDRRAFSLAVVSAIAITPIVWQHYFALLVLPLALARPRLAWPWALLWVFWLVPGQGNEGEILSIVFATAIAGAVVAFSTLTTARPSRP